VVDVFDDVYEVFGVFGAFDAYEVFNTFGERTRKGKRSRVRSKGSFVDNLTVFVVTQVLDSLDYSGAGLTIEQIVVQIHSKFNDRRFNVSVAGCVSVFHSVAVGFVQA
jgi:hypothetical protein|tara:strand:+ start:442 stop:765 length:324 start_codon:yes stop_codon:yes gene_type:complete